MYGRNRTLHREGVKYIRKEIMTHIICGIVWPRSVGFLVGSNFSKARVHILYIANNAPLSGVYHVYV